MNLRLSLKFTIDQHSGLTIDFVPMLENAKAQEIYMLHAVRRRDFIRDKIECRCGIIMMVSSVNTTVLSGTKI